MTDKQKENERKKEYLNQYMNLKKSIARLEKQHKEVYINKLLPSEQSYSDMPKLHNHTDLSDFAVKLSEVENKIIKLQYQRLTLQGEIFEKVEALENEKERAVLDYKYLHGYGWEKIATIMNYSYRQVTRIHGKALEDFKL